MFLEKFSRKSDCIYIFDMASKKIVKHDNSLFYASISFNFIAVIVILIIVWRKRKSSEAITQAINAIIQQTKRQQKTEANHRVQVINNYREQLRTIPIRSSGINLQLIDKKIFQFHQVTQTDKNENQLELIKILQEQLKIQRDRNHLLQQKQEKMQTKLTIQNPGDTILPEDYQNLKNQLEFCQQKLEQTILSEAQLKKKLADYERMSISMLNHPQYQRIRQLNNKYKDTIAELQNHLLLKNESKGNYFDLTFHNP